MLRKKTVTIALALVATVVWQPISGSGFARGDDKVPDTPAARRLVQLFELVNGSDKAALDKFLGEGFVEQEAKEVKDRIAQTEQVKSSLGKLTLRKVLESSAERISVVCDTTAGPAITLTMSVEPKEPHRIKSIGVTLGGDSDVDTSPLTAEQRKVAIETMANELRAKYVFPKVGEKMAVSVESSLKNGDYKEIESAGEFAEVLTKQLREICKDKHLRVRPGGISAPRRMPGRRQRDNHGFVKVESLPGGVGYLKFNFFSGEESARDVASAAMNFLANSEALIIDLRENGGGSPGMVAYLTSYLFEDRVHLNSIYSRPEDETREFWTQPDVPGRKLAESAKVYVLTSSRTFSGAEEFSYNLQNLKRATIVGETTGGGAHPVMAVFLGKRFSMSMPFARAINPITNTNWEGVGVVPDVKVDAGQALDKAIELARAAIEGGETAAKPKTVGGDTDEAMVDAETGMDVPELIDEAEFLAGEQEYAKAAKLLEKATKLEPDNDVAWFQLGYNLHMSGKIDKAIEVHKKAAEYERFAGIAHYNLGCAYSLKKDSDKAFEALNKALDLGFGSSDRFENDSDLDNIRDDDRYQKLIKKADGDRP